ncbi:MAG: hypothetical protein M0R20_05005 [Candidatus Omnitrophica bacterium]|jgi:hypothetical protein|nr:hypothetical protein [Candidatus Omnitrophota bacterium]
MHNGLNNFIDPIAKVWSQGPVLDLATVLKKKKLTLKAKRLKKRKPVIWKIA